MRHPFADAALFEEVFFQAADLLIEEIVCLVDKTECDVCYNLGGSVLAKCTEFLIANAGASPQTADI